jgi:hypothetical protein
MPIVQLDVTARVDKTEKLPSVGYATSNSR